MTQTRIYKTMTPTGARLVRATNKHQAISTVARQDDLVALIAQGVKVEEAGGADAD